MRRIDFFRLFAIARKEALQLRRDTRSLILAFVLPLFMVLFFGYAITWDVKDIRLALRDEDWTRASRELMEAFEASGYFSVEERPRSYREAADAVDAGKVRAALVIPPGFERDLGRREDGLRFSSSWTGAMRIPRPSP